MFCVALQGSQGAADCTLSKMILDSQIKKKKKERKKEEKKDKVRKLLLGSDSYLNPASLYSYRRFSFKIGHRNSFFAFFFFGANF